MQLFRLSLENLGNFKSTPTDIKGKGPGLVQVALWIAKPSAQGMTDCVESIIGIGKLELKS